MNNLTASDFADAIRRHQTTGEMSAALVRQLYSLASVCHAKHCRRLPRDDYRQECLVLYLRQSRQVPADEAYGYLAACFINLGRHIHKRARRELAGQLPQLPGRDVQPLEGVRPSSVVPFGTPARRERPGTPVTYRGVVYRSMHHLARVVGVTYSTLFGRLKRYGGDVERAVSEAQGRFSAAHADQS